MLDEPTGELDPGSSRQVFTLLRRLNTEYGLTVIVVEQKIMLLSEFVDELIVMHGGKIVFSGPVRDVLSKADALLELGVNCPRVATLAQRLREAGFDDVPVCVNVDEAEKTVRGLLA